MHYPHSIVNFSPLPLIMKVHKLGLSVCVGAQVDAVNHRSSPGGASTFWAITILFSCDSRVDRLLTAVALVGEVSDFSKASLRLLVLSGPIIPSD